jgi:hypothetical protein
LQSYWSVPNWYPDCSYYKYFERIGSGFCYVRSDRVAAGQKRAALRALIANSQHTRVSRLLSTVARASNALRASKPLISKRDKKNKQQLYQNQSTSKNTRVNKSSNTNQVCRGKKKKGSKAPTAGAVLIDGSTCIAGRALTQLLLALVLCGGSTLVLYALLA